MNIVNPCKSYSNPGEHISDTHGQKLSKQPCSILILSIFISPDRPSRSVGKQISPPWVLFHDIQSTNNICYRPRSHGDGGSRAGGQGWEAHTATKDIKPAWLVHAAAFPDVSCMGYLFEYGNIVEPQSVTLHTSKQYGMKGFVSDPGPNATQPITHLCVTRVLIRRVREALKLEVLNKDSRDFADLDKLRFDPQPGSRYQPKPIASEDGLL
ncbi:hypothetical protein BJ138DRAFT_691044 [Hygrophoropsis aurantiaca]|uniref:Uncharacterized protein n=1 Tax=Hygrophoropsis aurantiaca TaxID=72124 RepID=A0ACB8AS65_9AGAM|nr:hypothetical protein BJ138DRAFT_691044 [Hygrophoropsis aurantiaca]